jgi:hypothetical protein
MNNSHIPETIIPLISNLSEEDQIALRNYFDSSGSNIKVIETLDTETKVLCTKPFWKSIGFWGITLTMVVALNGPVNHVLNKGTFTMQDAWEMFQVLAACGVAYVGRVKATQPLDITAHPYERFNTIVSAKPPQSIVVEQSHPELKDGF